MDSQQIPEFDFEKLLNLLNRKKWLIIFCIVVALIPIVIYNQLSIPVYRAETVIVFDEQIGALSLINPFESVLTSSFITNQIEEIKSRSLAEEVVRSLPPGIIKTFPIPNNPIQSFDKEDFIVYEIQKSISASAIPNSEILKIQADAFSPIAAKVIANTVAEIFQKRNLDVRREETSNILQIINGQLIIFKGRLDSAEVALKNFKEQSKVTVIDKQAEEIFKRITEAEIIYNQTLANLDATKKRLDFIQNKLAIERQDLVPTMAQITSPWAKKLKQDLVDLQAQYTKLILQNYKEDHPKIQELKSQIEKTKENLKAESLKIASGENIIDPISQIQKFMEESITLEIEIQTYRAQEQTLKRVLDGYRNNLTTLPDKELRLAQLLRDKEVNEKVYTMLLHKKEEAKIAEAEKIGNIRIIDPAKTPLIPYKPRKKLMLFIGGVFGLLLGIGLTFLTEALDQSINSVEDIEKITDIIVLGSIPQVRTRIKNSDVKLVRRKKGKDASELISKLITIYAPDSIEADAFHNLRMNLQLANMDAPIKSTIITSSNPREGKSYIATNLSIVAAQLGMKTLLIDADMRKPILHKIFQKERAPGLVDLVTALRKQMTSLPTNSLLERKKISNNPKSNPKAGSKLIKNESVIPQLTTLDYILRHKTEFIKNLNDKYITATKIKNLDILTAGKDTLFSVEQVASQMLKNIFLELENRYDAIFIDTPPLNATTIARIFGSIAEATILVVKTKSSKNKDIIKAEKLLKNAHNNFTGIVLNCVSSKEHYKYYSYYSDDNNK